VKHSRPSARRLVLLIAAGVAGAAVSLFVASPALAHTASVSGVTACNKDTGGWTVTWTIENDFGTPATLDSLTPDPQGSAISGFAVNAVIPAASGGTNGKITGTQTFPAGETTATLIGHVVWPDKVNQALNATVDRPSSCVAHPQVSFKDNCDGTVTVTLDNQQGNAPATFKITGSPDKIVAGGQKLDVTVPGNVKVVVQVAGHDDFTHTWQTSPCPSPSPSLPTTGDNVASVATIGGVLLIGGIGLVVLAIVMRRRRRLAG
jgi:hypothetical protein